MENAMGSCIAYEFKKYWRLAWAAASSIVGDVLAQQPAQPFLFLPYSLSGHRFPVLAFLPESHAS